MINVVKRVQTEKRMDTCIPTRIHNHIRMNTERVVTSKKCVCKKSRGETRKHTNTHMNIPKYTRGVAVIYIKSVLEYAALDVHV